MFPAVKVRDGRLGDNRRVHLIFPKVLTEIPQLRGSRERGGDSPMLVVFDHTRVDLAARSGRFRCTFRLTPTSASRSAPN